jgi:hypothetical protein
MAFITVILPALISKHDLNDSKNFDSVSIFHRIVIMLLVKLCRSLVRQGFSEDIDFTACNAGVLVTIFGTKLLSITRNCRNGS